jgi:uncharacterized 2Fe-2S/4Fe-4S cluster protein (DUF4445 family)
MIYDFMKMMVLLVVWWALGLGSLGAQTQVVDAQTGRVVATVRAKAQDGRTGEIVDARTGRVVAVLRASASLRSRSSLSSGPGR